MGFGLQLRLLLWKNFTVKKRSPLVVSCEVLIPLVLFLILMGIRLRREPVASGEEYFPIKALPSAGIIPLLQTFCPSKLRTVDEHGFPVFPNSSAEAILNDVSDIFSSPTITSINDLKRIPDDYDDFINDPNALPARLRNLHNFTLKDVFNNQEELQQFLVRNLSLSAQESSALMNADVNGTEVSKLLLERRIDQIPTDDEDYQKRLESLQRSLILQALADPHSLTEGPMLLTLFKDGLGLIGLKNISSSDNINQTQLEENFKDLFLGTNEIHMVSCSPEEFNSLLSFPSLSADQQHILQRKLCNLSSNISESFSNELQRQLNWTAIQHKLSLKQGDTESYREKVERLREDLFNLYQFQNVLKKGSHLAQFLKINTSQLHEFSNKTELKGHNSQFAKVMWENLGPVLCGPYPKQAEEDDQEIEGFNFKARSAQMMNILFYMLTHHPKILYSPNGTQADEVIKKANRTFSDVDKAMQASKKWLGISQQIRTVLLDNRTQTYLHQLQDAMKKYPDLFQKYNNISYPPGKGYDPMKTKEYQAIESVIIKHGSTNEIIEQLDQIDGIVRLWIKYFHIDTLDLFMGFPNETMLEQYALKKFHQTKSGDVSSVVAGIVFTNMKPDGALPPHVIYKIRMYYRFTTQTSKIRAEYWRPGPNSYYQSYYYYGFIWMQDQIERAIIDVLVAIRDVIQPAVYLQEMPYPCYLKDRFMFVIEHMMPLCMTISWVYTVAITVQSIVYEKEQRLKEVMKMMGLSNAVHWVAWFITSMCFMSVTVLLLTIILKHGKILGNSNPFIIWLFLMIFAVATISFCFLLSVFFSKAKLAAACGGIIYFLTYMPYIFISIREEGDKVHVYDKAKTVASLFSTTAFGIGARYFALYEEETIGVQWSNIGQSPVNGDDFNLLKIMILLVMDTILYIILMWYIEAVHPGSYGIPRPWYFPFTTTYWFGHNHKSCPQRHGNLSSYQMMMADDQETPRTPGLLAFEREPIHLPLGVSIQNLVKVYKLGNRMAVNGLNLCFYEGQITSFLGHNGAGKTTTMSILTGLFPPTSGTALIYDNDIRFDMDEIRTSLGMCPQHNVLFDKLTIDEHLWFYSRLKGKPASEVNKEMNQILEDIDLPDKRFARVETLSGGMKRKLSVAMAFAGGSRTVILDEPTAGVDPFARRAIWDLLIKYKQGRTILLSTHFMDEADILGDRIAIISHGKLRCVGSSLFLKSHFGDGYCLTIVKKQSTPRGSSQTLSSQNGTPQGSSLSVHQPLSENSPTGATSNLLTSPQLLRTPSKGSVNIFPLEAVTAFIKSFIPNACLMQETAQELMYTLPYNSVKTGSLEKIFSDLDKNLDKLGIKSYGLRDTSLEEVFLKVTEATTQEDLDGCDDFGSTISPATSTRTNEKQKQRKESSNINLEMKDITLESTDGAQSDAAHNGAAQSDAAHNGAAQNESGSAAVNPDSTEQLVNGQASDDSNSARTTENHTKGMGSYTIKGAALKWQQFYGLLVKRFHHGRRNIKGVLSQILLPALFVSTAMIVALSHPPADDNPPLYLTPSMFPRPNYIPFSNEAKGSNVLAKNMENTLTYPSGVGATCCLRSINVTTEKTKHSYSREQLAQRFDKQCADTVSEISAVYLDPKEKLIYKQEGNATQSVKFKNGGPSCYCSVNMSAYICDPGAAGPKPNTFFTATQDTLQNVTGRNISRYLLYTTQAYQRHRYGGLTFGDIIKHIPPKLSTVKNDAVKRLAIREATKVWYNNKGYHSQPTYLNVMNNAILRASLPASKGNPAAYGITAINHPFNNTERTHISEDYLRKGTDVVIAIFVIIAMSFVPASFVVFLVSERSTKSKHLQFVSGVKPVIYWLSNYIWDMLNYLVPAGACITILYCFNVPAYSSASNFPAVVCLFVLYGWSITPLMYPATFYFQVASAAYVFLIILNLFVGITATVTTFMLELFQDDTELIAINNALKIIFLAFPNYCLGRGLMELAFNQYMNEYYNLVGESDKMRSPFEWDLVTRNLVCMFISGFLFFFVTLLMEYGGFFRRSKHLPAKGNSTVDEDEDVALERERVLSGEADSDILKLVNLTKVYHSRKTGKHRAVDRLCLGIPEGECFGLLGVNGAGKTTTFKMLTGDTGVSAGNAFLDSHSILREMLSIHKIIGYCPQFDALIDELTAREHLTFFCRLRGVPEKEIHKVVNWAIKKMSLSRYADKPSKTYSGGNKRKLSTAIALIGNPLIIFMDEPTTGMDPNARRFLWNLIIGLIKDGHSVVLTSHSMEECEALCTRLAIMVNGQFKCLGSTQHLKNRFGDGYIISVRVKGDTPDLNPVMEFFENFFIEPHLKEHHHNMLQYQIPSAAMTLVQIFGLLERSQESLNIEDYSVSQTTLDNVFINFAQQQTDFCEDYNTSSATTPRRIFPFGRKSKSGPSTRLRSLFTGDVCFSSLAGSENRHILDEDEDSIGADYEITFSHQPQLTLSGTVEL